MRLIFLDSDVIIDLILERIPYNEWALGVFYIIDQKQFAACTSVHSLLNVHYIIKKTFGEKNAPAAIKVITTKLSIVKEDNEIVQEAIESDFSDFEDAVQYYTAKSAGADAIITRNIKDYKEAKIPVYTAEQFLRTL